MEENRPRTTFSLLLELATLTFEFNTVTKKIRARGKYVAADLHKIQDKVAKIRAQLKTRLNGDNTLLSGLNTEEVSYEDDIVNYLKRDI